MLTQAVTMSMLMFQPKASGARSQEGVGARMEARQGQDAANGRRLGSRQPAPAGRARKHALRVRLVVSCVAFE